MKKGWVTLDSDYSRVELDVFKELGITPEILAANLAKRRKQEEDKLKETE